MNRILDVCFLVDMLLQFNLAFNSNDHNLHVYVTDRRIICSRYLRGKRRPSFVIVL